VEDQAPCDPLEAGKVMWQIAQGKSDPVDAEAAARAALAGQGLPRPKAADGTVEMLRVLRMARRSAIKARIQTIQQLDSLVVTAPDQLRTRLRRLSLEQLVPVAAGLRPGELAGPLAATKLALRTLARRHQASAPRWPAWTTRSPG
jgi:hypothetical protein